MLVDGGLGSWCRGATTRHRAPSRSLGAQYVGMVWKDRMTSSATISAFACVAPIAYQSSERGNLRVEPSEQMGAG